jgi:hypothetical protein
VEILKFSAFFALSYFILLQIFSLSTYHKYFFKALPLLVLYAAAVAYLLNHFRFHGGLFWQLIGFWALLAAHWKSEQSQGNQLVENSDEPQKQLLIDSMKNTKRCFWGSVCIFMGTFFVVYTFLSCDFSDVF